MHFKMHFLQCVLMLNFVISDDTLGFIVRGPSGPLVVPLGGSVILPCYVETPLVAEKVKVVWRRTDSETLVHLYQDGESQPDAQQQDYHDRAHFFTDQIQHGNFSLRLDNLSAQDKGVYRCKVYSQQVAGKTLVEIKDVERLLVSGSDESISASVGEDVTLNCSVDSHITPEHIEEVSWRKTDKDEDILVLLYQNNKSLSDSSDERYRDRVEFFTAEIPKGNFSLRLKSVRTEDKGVYTCQVFAGGLSANATVVLERLGFSVSHIMVLILCISASGCALVLCCLIYCRSPYEGFIQPFVPLGASAILPCYVDELLSMEGLKVEWRRTDSETLVHLYQDGESRSQQDYLDRAHFFSDPIQQGNFSLRLDDLRDKDEGEYTCTVYSQQDHLFSTKIILETGKHNSSSSFSGLTVRTPSGPAVVRLGSSGVLPCYVNNRLLEQIRKVEWRRTDSETLVHLYQDGESRAESQQQDYHDRAHFFTDQIQHGNFSLRLDNLRAEDEGRYTCKVYRQEDSVSLAKLNLELRLLDSFFHLQMFLVICPNIIMFFAFVLWGVSEGSVNESVCCCALYFLRPLILLWAFPYVNEFTGNIKTWILKYSYLAEYLVLSVVVYSALFASVWEKLLNYAEFDRAAITFLFLIMFLCCLCKIIYLLVTEVGKKSGQINTIINIFDLVADTIFDILPTLQFILLFFTFASVRGGFIIVVILPVLLIMTNDRCFFRWFDRLMCSLSVRRTVMLIIIIVIIAAMIGLYIFTLENKTDAIGWGCVTVFLQILWTVMKFTGYYGFIAQDFPRVVTVYVFGSVGVVLLNSFTLMTELILKTVNGARTVGDLRSVVFPSECFFVISVMISGIFPSGIIQCVQNTVKSRQMPADRSQID
ncbi:uncharacterized protein LOC107695642 [Sinocyclocheilus anshuiensis]|nr:PREDICTED: uncharacterized protein LOC107695642 [Sinocyclocheilus anshuiensis]